MERWKRQKALMKNCCEICGRQCPPDELCEDCADLTACNCAGCGRILLTNTVRYRIDGSQVQVIAGRFRGRPYCVLCLRGFGKVDDDDDSILPTAPVGCDWRVNFKETYAERAIERDGEWDNVIRRMEEY